MYYYKYKKYKKKYINLKFYQFGGNLVKIFSCIIKLNIVLGEETYYWMLNHYIKNWSRLTNSKFELNDVDNKFIKGIFTSTKNPNALILALNEIFNDEYINRCDRYNPINCRLNVDCAIGLELIKHYILINFFGIENYNCIISQIFYIIDKNKTNKKLIEIYGNDTIANTIICAFQNITHPLLAILWNNIDRIYGNNDYDFIQKLNIGDSIYLMNIKRLIHEDYRSLSLGDINLISIIDTNQYVGEWSLVLSIEPLKFVTTTSSGITYFNSIRDNFNNLQEKYNNYINSNELYVKTSADGKRFIESFRQKYNNPNLLKISIIQKKFNIELFDKLQSSQLDEKLFFDELNKVF